MSIWSTSTGRNSVFGAEDGAVLPSSHLPIHVHVARTHLRNADGHCFHKRFHNCQVGNSPLVSLISQFVSFLSLSGYYARYYTVISQSSSITPYMYVLTYTIFTCDNFFTYFLVYQDYIVHPHVHWQMLGHFESALILQATPANLIAEIQILILLMCCRRDFKRSAWQSNNVFWVLQML